MLFFFAVCPHTFYTGELAMVNMLLGAQIGGTKHETKEMGKQAFGLSVAVVA